MRRLKHRAKRRAKQVRAREPWFAPWLRSFRRSLTPRLLAGPLVPLAKAPDEVELHYGDGRVSRVPAPTFWRIFNTPTGERPR